MENNDSNLKQQPTGGLKLMTVFIAVLALHVLVIGSFTVWHLLNPGTDPDLALDKAHKGAHLAADGALPGDTSTSDTSAADKPAGTTASTADGTAAPAADSTATPPATTDVASTPATAPASATSAAASADTLAPKPAPEPLMVTPPPGDNDSMADNATPQTPTGPIQHGPVIEPPQSLAPPAETASTSTSATPSTTPAPVAATTDATDSSSPATDGTPYTVKRGDSLARIARRHHIAVARLKEANSLGSDLLHIGQKLVIPNRTEKLASTPDASEAASSPQLASADSVDTTPAPAASTGTETAAIKPTHLHHIKSSSVSRHHHLYTVVKGDTLMKIARKFRTTASAIAEANNITNASRLSIGKKLRIPSGESRREAASAREPAPSEPQEVHTDTHGQLANYMP